MVMAEYFFDNKKPMIPVFVGLNGKKGLIRVQGIVDTGSTFVTIPPAVAETMGYDLDNPEERVEVSTPSGMMSVPLITLDEVSIMGLTAPRVKTAVIPFPEQSRVNCLVGLTFLRNFSVSIDYPTGTLRIE
jgi:clan AA aspartic protease (TIGR02281 family)